MIRVTLEELSVPARLVSRDIDHELTPRIAKALAVPENLVKNYQILKRSIDARKKPDVHFLYRLCVTLNTGALPRNAVPFDEAKEIPFYNAPETGKIQNPIVVGSGPAGLFAALILAQAGCRPVVLEQGKDVTLRKQDIDRFLKTAQVDPQSNVLFGEGGAGTWSDGKLYTRIRDPRIRFVLETFEEAGAPEEILYYAHPHIGSDLLPGVIAAIRDKIIALEGQFLWGKKVSSVEIRNGYCCGVRLSGGELMEAPAVLIASGHSAVDLILDLVSQNVAYAMKGFQMGVRVEHPQAFIDHIQFGGALPSAGAAEYAIAAPQKDGSGMVSFCMCPGGELVPSVSRNGHLRTNGMSNSGRSGKFANSALVATIPANAFPDPVKAFRFLADYEKSMYEAGGGNYCAPAQNLWDYMDGVMTKRMPSTTYPFGIVPARMDRLFPRFLRDALDRALPVFDRKMPGFLRYGTMVGIETGVSSPVRFIRDEATLQSSIPGLWLAGEGAGTAGGITSAAVDGIRCAEEMLK